MGKAMDSEVWDPLEYRQEIKFNRRGHLVSHWKEGGRKKTH